MEEEIKKEYANLILIIKDLSSKALAYDAAIFKAAAITDPENPFAGNHDLDRLYNEWQQSAIESVNYLNKLNKYDIPYSE